MPIKATELRAASFEEAFGAGATELDALEALRPGTLGRLVRDALGQYYSEEAEKQASKKQRELEEAVREKIDGITARYSDELGAIRGLLNELEEVEVDTAPYQLERLDADVDDGDGWLFDSGRDYFEQLAQYRLHKGK